jgi:hypothetical protein
VRDVGVSVFPESEEVLIGYFGFGEVASLGVVTPYLQMRQSANQGVRDDAGMVQEFLKFRACQSILIGCEVGLASQERVTRIWP